METEMGSKVTIANFFKRLFGSRKMLLGMFGLAAIIASYLAPELAPRAHEIAGTIFSLVAVIAGLIATEDALRAWAERPTKWQEALQNVLDELESGGEG